MSTRDLSVPSTGASATSRNAGPPAAPGTPLPNPPDDSELSIYFGPQHRWVVAGSFLGSMLVLLSISLFIRQHVWGIWLAAPLVFSGVGAIISLASSGRRRRYTFVEHMARVTDWQPNYAPSVDVLLPSAGESVDMLNNTYTRVSQLQWHGVLNVLVLDDSDRENVRRLAEQFGFQYHVRPNRGELKKAGNLRYGFTHSDGDFIAVFDADFVPRRDYLYHLLPYMDDEKNAIVQSPQFFDFDKQRMGWVEFAAGATQVLFYRWVQPSRDRSNAAICVGTSAVYRRAALNKSGGFAAIGHSEDVHTGVNLMKVGYRVRYVPVVVSKGLCPSELDSFFTQQYRWCTGSMSLLLSRSFHRASLTPMQRMCYWSGFCYFISTGMNIFLVAVPPLMMAIFAPGAVNPTNYALVALAMAVRMAIVPFITLGRASVISIARIQMSYSFAHGLALLDILRHRTDSWVATGSAQRSRTAQRVGAVSRWWCIAVQVLLWVAIAWRLPVMHLINAWPLILLTLLNLYLVMPIIARRDVKLVR